MRITLAVAMVVLGMPALAHRLDEYLQGVIFEVEKDRIKAGMTLTPGVAVLPFLIASIDTDGDSKISEVEQHAYGAQVLRDLSLSMDGQNLAPKLVSLRFPKMEEMKEGRGEIRLEFDADLPRGNGRRTLTFENHHQNRIAAYQVNCVVPNDPDLRIVKQDRNYSQSFYQLEYLQTGAGSEAAFASWSRYAWLGAVVLLLCVRLVYYARRRIAI